MSETVATRLYIDAALAAGGDVELDATKAHRLRNVLRLGPGAAVAAFNARAGEWRCELSELGRNRARLTVGERLRPPEPETGPWLLFAPIKRAPLDWMVEKATELGAEALLPVWTERTQSERLNRERLRPRRSPPPSNADVSPSGNPRAGAARPHPCRVAGRALPAPVRRKRRRRAARRGAGELFPSAPCALLVGPEGGFSDAELDAFGKLPIVTRVGLGPRVLRAETAAIAALAAFQAISGDWHRVRRR
jgi:16S rRNA (uracil1498-N3)-methyltransferase